jgi:alkanesulfonate monooxygenase
VPLKFHWRLLQGGERPAETRGAAATRDATGLPDLEAQVHFCREAERLGIHGVLIDFGASKPDSIVLATALGLATSKIELIIAYRSGLIAPTSFVQQINTLSSLIQGRLSLNVVAGHSPEEQGYYGDLLARPERYARTAEFLETCLALWQRNGPINYSGNYYQIRNAQLNTPFVAEHRTLPEIFIAGGSDEARQLAIQCGTLWMQIGDAPENLRESVRPVLAAGKEVGLRLAVISRPTREEAVQAAHNLIQGLGPSLREQSREKQFVNGSDSVSFKAKYAAAGQTEWPKPYLWLGAVSAFGPATVCLVGSPQDLVEAFMEYRSIGVSQFILSGWPKLEEMIFFGEQVLPLVRKRENELAIAAQGPAF